MILENKIYFKLRDYIKANHGWSEEKLKKTSLWQEYLDFMENLRGFNNKRVKITYLFSNDWLAGCKENKGKIIINSEGKPCFLKNNAYKKGYYLDAGLYKGFYNTIIPLKIEVL